MDSILEFFSILKSIPVSQTSPSTSARESVRGVGSSGVEVGRVCVCRILDIGSVEGVGGVRMFGMFGDVSMLGCWGC